MSKLLIFINDILNPILKATEKYQEGNEKLDSIEEEKED
jgi:hypothetical protein